ncbi:abhydrolase domain-containing protein 3 [Dorcoceras hygrometricum]|uniref:Abhydrolase domain-containing protein 3 n=1 Tax=Dorcoceras hygrometricum TaxID=472368 RepID=A0A2Z7CQK5_9LAMI|nr:abhydrolase domain-containing protein 3 [Dorcoceras hygrometricum]
MESLNSADAPAAMSPYEALLGAAISVPISHYVCGFLLIIIVYLYRFLEIHVLQDLLSGFRGQPVTLTFNPSSEVYHDVISKCSILHGRYLSTPWLCSPHLQTLFIHYLGNPPLVNYRRQLFITSDGGTVALDWVKNPEVKKPVFQENDEVRQDNKNPIIIIIPGLTSDSDSAYVKHLAFKMAKHGWNVVVTNHRGLGGVSITSDCFYSAGWTEDVRKIIDHIHCKFPEAPLFVVGTSIGANILIKYLGEDGVSVPISGAAAICSPWDPLICDRFMNRRLVQRFYNKALAIGLKDYANVDRLDLDMEFYRHEAVLSRLSNWEGVKKSRSVRDFDDCATRVLGNFETVDTYYRRCASANFVGSVAVPLLCINSLDDPVCTSEAIPWDECRLNSNIVLATTQHGGHLPYFEGLAAKSVWWVRAVEEFFSVLQSSPLSHRKKEMPDSSSNNPFQSSIDHAPYVHILEDGIVTAVGNEVDLGVQGLENADQNKTQDMFSIEGKQTPGLDQTPHLDVEHVGPVKKSLNQISRQNRKSLWLLGYIAIITTWPLVGSALKIFFKKKFQNRLSLSSFRR